MPNNRYLTKNEYSRIRYHAKKMGASDISLSSWWHHISFKYTSICFSFKPFEYRIHLVSPSNMWAYPKESDFTDAAGVQAINEDMQKMLELLKFLKTFDT